jgi:hypothetical protein
MGADRLAALVRYDLVRWTRPKKFDGYTCPFGERLTARL